MFLLTSIFALTSCQNRADKWLESARAVADSTMMSAFGVEAVEDYFELDEDRSFYWDTTTTDTVYGHHAVQLSYRNGINYIPYLYTFVYRLKEDHTTFPFERSVTVKRDFGVYEAPEECCTIVSKTKLPDRAQLAGIMTQFGFNTDSCETRYGCLDSEEKEGAAHFVLVLSQIIRVLPEDRVCEDAYLEKTTLVDPLIMEMVSTSLDTVRWCQNGY